MMQSMPVGKVACGFLGVIALIAVIANVGPQSEQGKFLDGRRLASQVISLGLPQEALGRIGNKAPAAASIPTPKPAAAGPLPPAVAPAVEAPAAASTPTPEPAAAGPLPPAVAPAVEADDAAWPPTGLTYPGIKQQFHVGQDILLIPSSLNGIKTFKVSPALPIGLSLDAATGVIQGQIKPDGSRADDRISEDNPCYHPVEYTVTATNSAGAATIKIAFPIEEDVFSYPGAESAFSPGDKVRLEPLFADIKKNEASSWSIMPPLLDGLTLDTYTGVISGTLGQEKSHHQYIVTAELKRAPCENLTAPRRVTSFAFTLHVGSGSYGHIGKAWMDVLYATLDKDAGGEIGKSEWDDLVKGPWAEPMWSVLDENGDKSIDRKEFEKLWGPAVTAALKAMGCKSGFAHGAAEWEVKFAGEVMGNDREMDRSDFEEFLFTAMLSRAVDAKLTDGMQDIDGKLSLTEIEKTPLVRMFGSYSGMKNKASGKAAFKRDFGEDGIDLDELRQFIHKQGHGVAEAPTEAPTEAATEAPTEAATEAPTEAPTKAPTIAKVLAKPNPFTYDSKANTTFTPCQSHSVSVVTDDRSIEYTIAPTLPKGLHIDSSTGTISGLLNATEAEGDVKYVVMARNAAGNSTAAITLSLMSKTKCPKSNTMMIIGAVVLALLLCLICYMFCVCCKRKKEEPYAQLPLAPAPVPEGLPLTWDTGSGNWKTVLATQKPLGLIFEKHNPIKITAEKDSHGKDLGIKVGWTLVTINNKDITGMTFEDADQLLHTEVGKLPGGIPLTWETGSGEQTVWAFNKPLGLTFDKVLPIKITKENSNSHGEAIGIKIGWVLKKINYKDVTKMTNFQEVDDILHTEIGKLPSGDRRPGKSVFNTKLAPE